MQVHDEMRFYSHFIMTKWYTFQLKGEQLPDCLFQPKRVHRHIWGRIIRFETKSPSFVTVQNQLCHTSVSLWS